MYARRKLGTNGMPSLTVTDETFLSLRVAICSLVMPRSAGPLNVRYDCFVFFCECRE